MLSSPRMTMDDEPPPVPGFERFRWSGAPVFLPIKRSYDFRAQLVRRGGEAGIVLVVVPDPLGEHIASITLDGAFSSWPPRVGELVVHRPVQTWNRTPRLAARSSDDVLVWSGEPFTFAWGRPGSTPYEGTSTVPSDGTAPERSFGPGDDALLVGRDPATDTFELARSADGSIRVRRPGAGPSSALGELPVASHRVVTTAGIVLGVQEHAPVQKRSRRSAEPAPARIETSVFPHVRGSGATFELPARARVADLVADHDGGAWLACWSSDGGIVYHLDANGRPGGPVRIPYGHGPGGMAIASWREGYVRYCSRRGIALVVTDGTHMTRVEGLPGGEQDVTMDTHSLLVSDDARSILLCHRTILGIQLMRADLASAVPGESLPDVWAEDRLAFAAVLERRAAEAATPPLPGWAMETTSDGSVPPRLHTNERIVRQVRVRHLLSAIGSLYFGECARFRGDAREGAFSIDDGSGGHEHFAWSTHGLVGVSYHHELGGPMGEEANAEDAPTCFPDLPESLRPLLEQAIRVTSGRVSGGLWVTTGAAARWREAGSFSDHFGFYTMTPEASVRREENVQSLLEILSLDDTHAQLAIDLAAKASAGPHVLSDEEERVLLSPPSESPDAKPTHVVVTARALAAAGIIWRDAEARVAEHIARRTDEGLGALGALQVELLRAAERGDEAVVAASLDAGADVECLAVDGVFPDDDRELARLRLRTRSVSPLAVATSRGHEDIVDLLLGRGATLEGRPPKPQRPPALVAALLARRSALFVRLAALAPDLDADALLHTHIHQRHPTTIEVVRLLLERGANPRTGAEVRGVLDAAKAAGDEQLIARFRKKPG
jgi:hypothetical protein